MRGPSVLAADQAERHVLPGDTIRVQDRSRADLALLDQSVLRLNSNTELTVEPVKDQRTGVVNPLRGATHFLSRGPRSLEVQTPFITAGVRGTEIFHRAGADRDGSADDLGFQRVALVEGWKSVNTDPTNSSAHRFLADSYAALPRHEIARVSELRTSQLLRPLNMTPLQPRLAEANLFLISAGGPGTLSFNEFNPLFNRNGVSLLTTGLAGENETWAGEAVLAGIYQKLSVSVGYTHFETNEFRSNSGQDDDIANAFVQLELTPQTSVEAEYRYRNSERGDLRLRFFPDDVFPDERKRDEVRTYRFGVRHAFSPRSTGTSTPSHSMQVLAKAGGQ